MNKAAIIEYLKEPEKFRSVYGLIEQQREEMINGIFETLIWIIYTSPSCDNLVKYAEMKFDGIKELSGGGLDVIQELHEKVNIWRLQQNPI